MTAAADLRAYPVTPKRWGDLVDLFGENGACGGCWCMWFRQTGSQFQRSSGAPNKRALQSLVRSGRPPGLIAYRGRIPMGWVSVAPRPEFARIERSRILRRVDDAPVWSIVCFYTARSARGTGIAAFLLESAVSFAARKGARIVEAYPLDGGRVANASAYVGIASMFRAAGFIEVARRSPTRPVMRLEIGAR